MNWFKAKSAMVGPDQAMRGREAEMAVPERHLVLGTPLRPPVPDGFERAIFAMGCFWGAERKFWLADGVSTTAAGYSGGYTPNPTYEEVCSGRTGHAEAILVVFDGAKTSYEKLLSVFWENHDPTQGMRQGNDAGTQYRSAIYTTSAAQQLIAEQLVEIDRKFPTGALATLRFSCQWAELTSGAARLSDYVRPKALQFN